MRIMLYVPQVSEGLTEFRKIVMMIFKSESWNKYIQVIFWLRKFVRTKGKRELKLNSTVRVNYSMDNRIYLIIKQKG